MRVTFDDDELRKLYEDPGFRAPEVGAEVVKAFRKKMAILEDAATEQDLRAFKSLHFEKLVGKRLGQHSIRLNLNWRLILRLESDAAGRVVAVEIINHTY